MRQHEPQTCIAQFHICALASTTWSLFRFHSASSWALIFVVFKPPVFYRDFPKLPRDDCHNVEISLIQIDFPVVDSRALAVLTRQTRHLVRIHLASPPSSSSSSPSAISLLSVLSFSWPPLKDTMYRPIDHQLDSWFHVELFWWRGGGIAASVVNAWSWSRGLWHLRVGSAGLASSKRWYEHRRFEVPPAPTIWIAPNKFWSVSGIFVVGLSG